MSFQSTISFWDELNHFLLRHFTSSDAKLVLQAYKQVSVVLSLSFGTAVIMHESLMTFPHLILEMVPGHFLLFSYQK